MSFQDWAMFQCEEMNRWNSMYGNSGNNYKDGQNHSNESKFWNNDDFNRYKNKHWNSNSNFNNIGSRQQEDELHNPAGSSSYRFICNIDLITIIDLRFGNKAHFEPIQLKQYDHVLDEHLTMQLDQLIQNVNYSNNRFNLKSVK